ncbi:MAG: ATP-binding protein [Ideonella sp.]|nr:ATP-binding protein [Ideonella sp.]MCC7457450.1 ATP-binding protein [Nitrospira sp.]
MADPASPAAPRPAPTGAVITLVGAESTGKTTLAHALADALRAQGRRVTRVDEVLREWCVRERRTPRADEQAAIAQAQTQRIAAAAAAHEIVVADTSALMVAVYSQLLFDDTSLLAPALAAQRTYCATLLTALDLPWVADGHLRDGPHVQAPVDALVRAALRQGGIGFSVVGGRGEQRLAHALRAAQAALQPPSAAPRWRHVCAECGDPDCERHLLERRAMRGERTGG